MAKVPSQFPIYRSLHAERNCQFGRRCGKQRGVDQIQRPRFGAVGDRRINLDGLAFPGCAVINRASIGSEARGVNQAAFKCELMIERWSGGRRCARRKTTLRLRLRARGLNRRQAGISQLRLGGADSADELGWVHAAASCGSGKAFEIECQVARGLKTLLRFFLQATPDSSFDGGRDGLACRADFRRVFFQDGRHRFGRSVAPECALARKHFVQNCSESENIGARVGRFAANLLRRHVTDGAEHHARSGFLLRVIQS